MADEHDSTRKPEKENGQQEPPRHLPPFDQLVMLLPKSERAVLYAMKEARQRGGTVTIGTQALADATGRSTSGVKTAVRQLIDRGVIERISEGESDHTPATYRLLFTEKTQPITLPTVETLRAEVQPKPKEPPKPRHFPTWDGPPATTNELIDRYLQWARSYYVKPNGIPSPEPVNLRVKLKPLRMVAGEKDPTTLTADDLIRVQYFMADASQYGSSVTRGYINDCINAARRLLKWATKPPQRWIPLTVLTDAQLVEPLKRGRSGARESEPVRGVEWETVERTLPYMLPQVRAMVLIQWECGARPGEICNMRPCDIDTTGPVWMYCPPDHKTAHHGIHRTIALNATCQELIQPYMENRPPDAYLFSPAEAMRAFRIKRHLNRQTPIQYGNTFDTNRVKEPQRVYSTKYRSGAYRNSVHHACRDAFQADHERLLTTTHLKLSKRVAWRAFWQSLDPESYQKLKAVWDSYHWSPNQLRHAAAVRFRDQHGIDAAQAVLGHTHIKMTEHYAKISNEKLVNIMRDEGGAE